MVQDNVKRTWFFTHVATCAVYFGLRGGWSVWKHNLSVSLLSWLKTSEIALRHVKRMSPFSSFFGGGSFAHLDSERKAKVQKFLLRTFQDGWLRKLHDLTSADSPTMLSFSPAIDFVHRLCLLTPVWMTFNGVCFLSLMEISFPSLSMH